MENINDITMITENTEQNRSTSDVDIKNLPDVRDGLKVIQRRILWAMSSKRFGKTTRSSLIVGEVLGKYHPHGDMVVYRALLNLAQGWKSRYILLDGQGNLGSSDSEPDSYRYTEIYVNKMGREMLLDIDKDVVDFCNNFLDSLLEPLVLPAKLPNLLINGTFGLQETLSNMPPHNLGETVDAIIAWIDNNEIGIEELMQYIKGPDFPAGGVIYGIQGIKQAYETGKAQLIVRAKTAVELINGYEHIVITDIPYLTGKKSIIDELEQLRQKKKIESVTNIKDESGRDDIRIVLKLKKKARVNEVLDSLFEQTGLQTTFSIHNLALVDGVPCLLTLKDIIKHFVNHRHDIIVRRTQFELKKAEERLHIVSGFQIAFTRIDEVMKTIRCSKTPDEAILLLMEHFSFTETQADMIIKMPMRYITKSKHTEQDKLAALTAHLNAILQDNTLQMQIIKDELLSLKNRFDDGRKTDIVLI
jgi:DNA gyrase subunit A